MLYKNKQNSFGFEKNISRCYQVKLMLNLSKGVSDKVMLSKNTGKSTKASVFSKCKSTSLKKCTPVFDLKREPKTLFRVQN